MKQQKINVLYAVDLEDNTKQSLMALPSGVACPRDVAESVVRDFFGPYACDSDEHNIKAVVDAVCDDRQIDICGYTIFFDEVTLYTDDNPRHNRLDDIVTVTCYNKTELLPRRMAMEFYYECMCNSEGSEHERYETIFFQLMRGSMTAHDGIRF